MNHLRGGSTLIHKKKKKQIRWFPKSTNREKKTIFPTYY